MSGPTRDPMLLKIRIRLRPTTPPSDPRVAEERLIDFRICADETLRSNATFAVRYADSGRIYRRALVVPTTEARGMIEVSNVLFPPFRDCAPELLGWAARPDLGAPSGVPSDADPLNDDPDYVAGPGVSADPIAAREHEKFRDEERLRDHADLSRWGTRCRRCGAIDTAIRHTPSGEPFRVQAVGPGELRSDQPAFGVPPLPAPGDAYQCAACDATIQGMLADDLVETVPVARDEGNGIRRIADELHRDDDWSVVGFEQASTDNGVAFSGRLLRQGREVAWFEHQGNGGAMNLGILAAARENGDGEHLYREIRRVSGPTAFEPEEPFILAILERQGL